MTRMPLANPTACCHLSLYRLSARAFMTTIDLVIFDCDGVLIDSEVLSGAVYRDELEKSGIALAPDVFFRRMIGRSFEQAAATVLETTGKSLPEDFRERLRTALLARFEANLKPMAGIRDLLARLNTRMCVATSSDPVRAARSLSIAGLDGFFTDRVFTASMVKHGKPAPDLFLHAADRLGISAGRCLVIEDSAYGLIAAKAAGMTAWHFQAGSHFEAGYAVDDTIPRDFTAMTMADLVAAAVRIGIA